MIVFVNAVYMCVYMRYEWNNCGHGLFCMVNNSKVEIKSDCIFCNYTLKTLVLKVHSLLGLFYINWSVVVY